MATTIYPTLTAQVSAEARYVDGAWTFKHKDEDSWRDEAACAPLASGHACCVDDYDLIADLLAAMAPPAPRRETAESAYAAAQRTARALLVEVGGILDEHQQAPGKVTWGHVTYITEVSQALQRLIDDYEA